MYWVKHRIEYLKKWREAVKSIVSAVKSLGIEAKIYVVGSAAEGKLTVLSDVDVLVCIGIDLPLQDLYKLKKEILFKAIDDFGLPWDYPIDLHVYTEEGCREFLRFCRKAIDAEKL